MENIGKVAQESLLILGATGTGKTPLGEYLAEKGIRGRSCVHFDFGTCLRSAAGGGGTAGLLSDSDIARVREVLDSNALLEDGEFHIARSILESFLKEKAVGDSDLLVLNGLPRHSGQAEHMADIADIRTVLLLDCEADVVFERIRTNSGGDRAMRSDDSSLEIEKKLDIFRERTSPLLDYFGARGVRVEKVAVGVDTCPADIVRVIENQ